MEIIKDFFWFWIDWFETETEIKNNTITLNDIDIEYIESKQFNYLTKLWIKLDREHNQYFAFKKRKIGRGNRFYYYNWINYTMTQLSRMSWVGYQTIYNRINRHWMSVEVALTKKPWKKI